MDFRENNRLYEIAATDSGLSDELTGLYKTYASEMHTYINELARKYGVELEKDCFEGSLTQEEKNRKYGRLRLVGLILQKKPDELDKLIEFSSKLDSNYAEEKISIARRWGIDLNLEETKQLSLGTGIL